MGLIKMKKKVDFKIHFRSFKAVLDHAVFFVFFKPSLRMLWFFAKGP